jgi:hypothetical protein
MKNMVIYCSGSSNIFSIILIYQIRSMLELEEWFESFNKRKLG